MRIQRFTFLSARMGVALGMASVAMAQVGSVTSVSAASYQPIVAPDSIVSAWGTIPASTIVNANVSGQGSTITLPTTLGTVSLSLTDSAKVVVTPSLYMVSPGQINYVLPSTTAVGAALLSVKSGATTLSGPVLISTVSPGIFTADGSGTGVPAAQVVRVNAAGVGSYESPLLAGSSTYAPSPITLTNAPGDIVYLMLYGTGIRHHSLNPVIATIGGVMVPVQYAGSQSQYPGLDQINLGPLPQTLVGKGTVDVVVTVDGVPANTSKIAIR